VGRFAIATDGRGSADNLRDQLRLIAQMGQAFSGKEITKTYDEFEEYSAASSEHSSAPFDF